MSSFLLSLLFLVGRIDQDYFSFYYIGRGVADGADMFRDYADNKGPVLYLFFTALYKLFGNYYLTALIFASTLVDSLALIGAFLFFKKRFNISLSKGFLPKFLIVFFAVLFYKSFSIGSFMGGFYAETLGLMFVVFSLYFLEARKYFLSGLLFCLAFLCRLTLLFWLIYFLYILLKQKFAFSKLVNFAVGFCMPLVIVLIWYWLNENLIYFFGNMININFSYASAVKSFYFRQLAAVVTIEMRIFVSVVASLIIFILLFNKKDKYIFEFGAMGISGILASFVGGLFYFHHFIQFSLVFLFLLLYYIKKYSRKLGVFLIFLVSILLIVNYALFVNTPQLFSRSDIDEISKFFNKEYIQVVTYYPELYVRSDNHSFDRYYQIFHISSFYNVNSKNLMLEHIENVKYYGDKTAFVFVEQNQFDADILGEYKQFLEDEGGLELKQVFHKKDPQKTITIYETNN